MQRISRLGVFTSALTFVLASTGSALALSPENGTCADTSDCESGLNCQVVGASGCAVAPCEPGTSCEPVPCETVEIKQCVKPPCKVDADCGPGLRCEVSSMQACPACDSRDGADCPQDCTTSEMTSCVPKACKVDADCSDPDLECITQSWESCAGAAPACEPNTDCPAPEEPSCTRETVSFCGPKYLGECSAAADCGEGFDCVALEECSCSSGGGVSTDPAEPAPGGAAPIPAPTEPDCTCTPTDRKYCEPKRIECKTAADCPESWLCAGGDVAVGAPCAPDGECPTPEPTTSVCSPPSWGGIVYRGEANANGGPVYAPEGGYDSIGLDSSSASDDGKDAAESSSDDSGCQVGGGRPAHLGLLGLLGLAWLVRRRRQG